MEIDYIFILGGDGSILWTLKKLHSKNINKKIIAVNTGTVGFICQFDLDKWLDLLIEFKKTLEEGNDDNFQVISLYRLQG